MKKLLLALGLVLALRGTGMCYNMVFDQAFSTWNVTGVRCSTGAATDLTQAISSFTLAGFRITNQDTSNAVWLGHGPSVSSNTSTGASFTNLGEKLAAGSNGTWNVGRDPVTFQRARVWCLAADGAAAAGVVLSVATFSFK